MQQDLIRLNKFISESGLCSRREADRFITKGNVFINGHKAKLGDQVKPGDRVKVNGNELEPRQSGSQLFIALNKPVGITSTTENAVRDNIVKFVNHSERIFPIGRLDKDSQGLIFLTNNGDMVNKILRAGNNHEKEYVVTVNKPLTDSVFEGMSAGVPMLGVTTKKCKITQESSTSFRIVLVQGLNRQIRRMCEYFGYEVTKLERVRIMNISLKGLPLGDWRDLTESEMGIIYSMVEDSSSDVIRSTKSAVKKNSISNMGESVSQKHTSAPKKHVSRSGSNPSNTTFGKSRSNTPDKAKRKQRSSSVQSSGRRKSGRR